MAGITKKDKVVSLDSAQIPPASPDRLRTLSQLLVAPWPEWSDADINAEKWEAGLNSQSGTFERVRHASLSVTSPLGFENSIGRVCLPSSIGVAVHEWRRALAINPHFVVLPEDVTTPDLDLISSSEHILHSEIMRHIVTSITNLHHLAALKPFDDTSGENYVPNGGRVWKPWNHVYALCKVGNGTRHKPIVNKFGRYVVRLYFLGKWRRITIDDFLPLDAFGRILLPMTNKNELWPILLAKAVLGVAALTWTPTKEVVEMNAISCFTGWSMLAVECLRVPAKDVWLVCQKALMNEAENDARFSEEPREADAYQLGTRRNTGTGDFNSNLLLAACNSLEEGWGAVAVCAEMCDLGKILEEEVEEIGPCVGHQVLFTEARVIRLGDDGGPLPLWKTFRWKNWALKMGIIQPEHLVNVKSLRVFAPLKKWVVPSPRSATSIHAEMARLRALEEEQMLLEGNTSKKKRKGKGKGAGKKVVLEKKSEKRSDKSDKKSAKSRSGSKGSGKKKEVIEEVILRENSDPWLNFNVYSQYVTSLQLFYRASSFKCRRSTHDSHTFLEKTPKEMPEKGANKEKVATKKSVSTAKVAHQNVQPISTTKHKIFRKQDYFYLSCDSPTAKKIFFTVAVVLPAAVAAQSAILNNAVLNETPSQTCAVIIKDFKQTLKPATALCRQNLVVAGTKTRLLALGEGLVNLRIWADLPEHSFLQIVSQTEFRVGTIEMVNETTSRPSSTFNLYGSRISSAFSKLSECVSESPEHVQALEEFHSSYLPDNLEGFLTTSRNVNKFASTLREQCEEACTGLLHARLKHDFEQFYKALKEFQVLMMAPEFGMRVLQNIAVDFYDQIVIRELPVEVPSEVSSVSLEIQESFLAAGDSNEEQPIQAKKTDKGKEKGKGKGQGKEKDKNNDENIGEDKSREKVNAAARAKDGKKKEKKGKPDNSPKSGTPSGDKKSVKNQPQHILFDDQANSGMALMSKILEINPEALKYYQFRHDLIQRTVIQEYTGIAAVSPYGDWFPIARLVVNLDECARENAENSILLFCSSALCFFQVSDNDTRIARATIVGPICRTTFTRNTFGYTIFAYGFCGNVTIKEHTWKIQIVARNYKDMLHRCLGQDPSTGACITGLAPPLKVKHVYGHYIPNRFNSVLRCILTVHCTQILNIRVSLSDPKAAIYLKILHDGVEDEEAAVVYTKMITGRFTLPSLPFVVDLPKDGKVQKPKVFLIEAVLAHAEGWPLTGEELALVTSIKEKQQRDLLVFASQPEVGISMELRHGSQGLTKRVPRSQEIIPLAAYWCVQVVTDEELDSKVHLELNTRKAQEIRRLKEGWEKAEPGRHVRAHAERQKMMEQREEETRRNGESFAQSKLFQTFQLKESGIAASQLEEWKVVAEDYGNEQQERRKHEQEEHDLMMKEFAEKMANICQDQKATNEMIERYMLENKAASRALLESGYKMREFCLVKPDGSEPVSAKKEKKVVKSKVKINKRT